MWRDLICAAVAMYCNASPDLAIIQTAYDHEAASGSKLHDKDLKILQTKCHEESKDSFLCEVTFTSTTDANERLYFDIIAVSRNGDSWELKSGLCKR